MKYAVYRREMKVLPRPAPRFSIELERHLGTLDNEEAAIAFAAAFCDERVFVREAPDTEARCPHCLQTIANCESSRCGSRK